MKALNRLKSLRLTLASSLALAWSTSLLVAEPNIKNVVETDGDNEATDTITAKWTGVAFVSGIANEPLRNTAASASYTVGLFVEDAPCFVDRAHQWNGATAALPIPKYLLGGEYIMSGNDNRDNFTYQLDITIAEGSYVYMLIDDRMGDGSNANPPNFPDWAGDRNGDSVADMAWIVEQGWEPVKTGYNRFANLDWPDHIGMDEDGTLAVGPGNNIQQYASIYMKQFPAGTFSIYSADNSGQNMYGVVVKVVPKAPFVSATRFDIFSVTFEVTDGSVTILDPASPSMTFNDAPVAVTSSKSGKVTTVKYTSPIPIPSGSTNTAVLSFKDSAQASFTETFTFVMEVYATLTASDSVPRTSVDLASSGFLARVAQARDSAGWPGNDLPNNTKRAEDQLAGRILDPINNQPLANYAIPGTGPQGTHPSETINWNQDLRPAGTQVEIGNFQTTSTPPAPDQAIPGIPGTDPDSADNIDNIAAEIIGYLDLKAGVYRLGVNSDDGFRLTAAANPRDPAAKQLGVFSGGRGSADSLMYVVVEQDGVYPVRLIWYEGGGGANVEFFSVNLATGDRRLINDRANGGITSYSAFTAAQPPTVSVSPLHTATGVWANSEIVATITDQTTSVASGTITLSLNGNTVAPTVTKVGSVTTVRFDPPGLLPSGSINNVVLTFNDTGSPANTVTASWSFTVHDYSGFPVIPASFAVPLTSVDRNSSGFTADVYQTAGARAGFADNNSSDAAEFHIARKLIDPGTGLPYENLAFTGINPDGTHPVELINWHQTAPANAGGFNFGNGFEDAEIPGIPSSDANNIVSEITTFLDLKAGQYQLIVNSDDGFKVTTAPTADDIFPLRLGLFNTGRGAADTAFNFVVEQDGIYPFRLLWWEGTGGASVEFVVVNVETSARTLINDRTRAFTLKAYNRFTGTPIPAVTSVRPRVNQTTVLATTKIEAVIENLGTSTLELYLDNVKVTPTVTTVGTTSTVSFTPAQPFEPGSAHSVRIVYGAVSNSWSFTVARGPKVLLIVGDPAALNPSDAGIRDRLNGFGFDVVVLDDSASQTIDAEGAVLVIVSSTVGSGNVNTKFRDVAVPVVNWEQAVQDDFLFTGNVDTVDRGEVTGQTEIVITDASHPLAAGLAAGTHIVATSARSFTFGVPASTAATVATLNDGTGRGAIYGYEKGALLIDSTTAAPERRVQLFMTNDGFANLTAAGLRLFDAALEWAMNRKLQTNPPQFTSIRRSNGNLVIEWTGGGTLETTDKIVGGTWTNTTLTSPASIPETQLGNLQFARVRQ